MKIFVIVEKGYEYNDEYYEEQGLAGLTRAYRSEEKAQAECFRLNKARRSNDMVDSRDHPITDFYDVLALEVADEEVVTAPVSSAPVLSAPVLSGNLSEAVPDAYQASREAVRQAREQATIAARRAFEKGAAELFARHPELEQFAFTAYTDYFNDGDTCSYHVRSDEPDINDGDFPGRSDRLRPAAEAVRSFIQLFDEEDVYAMFGDHIRVIVSRPGVVDTEDYSNHD